MLKPLKRRVVVRSLELALTESEWEAVQADARDIGVTVGDLLSLVVAFSARAHVLDRSGIALADILPWSRLPGEPAPEVAR